MIRFALCLAIALCFAGHLAGQNASPSALPQISFTFERPLPGVPVPRYSFVLHADGSGIYHAEVTVLKSMETQPVDKSLSLLPATVQTLFDAIHLVRKAKAPCAATLKNIADTGTKTLTYRDAEGEASCTFNYSENKGVVQLTDLFQGMELTLEAGRALEFKHRFDRLGLDAEMISLAATVESGRATGLELIAPTLRSIAGDTELIERVRLRAAKLVEKVR